MKIDRARNTGRGIVSGVIGKIFQMLMPFIMRTMMIYYMGEEYLGLNSLFTSVLQVLNLAELGIGSAMVFSMYKPIAEDDEVTICALMKLYRTYYRIIGALVGILGLLLIPLLPHFVKGHIPEELSMLKLYLMNLAATVLSYWLFSYRISVLSAHQRIDVTNFVVLGTQVLQYALQALVVIFLKDYYLYVWVILITQILSNLVSAFLSKRMYPQYAPRGDMDREKRKELDSRIRDLFISKVGGVVLGSADTIVISAFLGLSVLAVYQNYFFIVSSVCGLVEVILNAMLAGLGNSLVTENAETNIRVMHRISILFTWMVAFCTCCFAGIFQPFMKLWMGEGRMLPMGMVVSFCVYFIVYEFTRLFNTFKNAAGQWRADRFRPLISAVVNLIMNLALVRSIGLYGILWSTIFALAVVEIPWLIHNTFATVYREASVRAYGRVLGRYLLAGLLAWGITMLLTSGVHLGDKTTFLLCTVLSMLVPVLVFLLLFRKRPEFVACIELLERMTGNRVPIRRMLCMERA